MVALSDTTSAVTVLVAAALIFLVGILLGAVISHFLNSKKIKTLGENLFEPDYEKAKSEAKPWYKTFWGWHLFVTILVLFIVGLFKTKFSINEGNNLLKNS